MVVQRRWVWDGDGGGATGGHTDEAWEEAIVALARPGRGHPTPCRATGAAPVFGPEAETGVRGKPEPESLLGFPRKRQTAFA